MVPAMVVCAAAASGGAGDVTERPPRHRHRCEPHRVDRRSRHRDSYALGRRIVIVAVDTTSLYPPQALHAEAERRLLPRLSAEGVLGLNPSLVLAIDGAGPKETIAVLESAAVPLVRVPDRYDGSGIVEKIRMVADVAAAGGRGDCLAHQVESDLASLASLRAGHPAGASDVRHLVPQRQADGRGPQHRG